MRRYMFVVPWLFAAFVPLSRLRAATPETYRFIDRGVELFDLGRWNDARHEFLRARRTLRRTDRAERQQVEYYLAACAVELGSRDAGGGLRSFLEKWPESVYRNDVLFSLGSYYCTRDDMQAAARTFAEVDYEALDAVRRERYDIRMGYAAFGAGRYDEAYGYFARIAPESEYADHALYFRSYVDYLRGDDDAARAGFERLASSEAYGALVPYYLLQLGFREGDYRYVVREGEALAAKAAPSYRVELERMLAEAWFHLDEYARALDCLAAYRRDGGAFGRNEEYLTGYSLYRTARYEAAEPYLRRACGAADDLTQNASYHLADCYVRRGAKQEAMQAFAMAADGGTDAAIAEDALFNYGKLQYELGGGAFNGAINVLTRYLERYPSSPRAAEARELLVAAYYNARDYDAAYEAIRAVADPDADIRAAKQKIAYFRALEAWSAGDREEAKRLLAESAAVGVSPRYGALALFWQGEMACAEGEWERAAELYDSYMLRAPRTAAEYALSEYGIGYCRFAQRRMAEAGASFERFLARGGAASDYRDDARNRLGDTRYAMRDFDGAAAEYARVAASDTPAKYYAQYRHALTLGLMGRHDEKIAALRRIVAADEGGYVADASYELGRTCLALGRYAEGAEALESFVGRWPSSPLRPRALADLGLAWLNLGDRDRSLEYYDLAVSAAPHSAEAKGAMEGIRDIYVSSGDVEAYFDYAERVGLESDVTLVARDSLTFAAARQLYLARKDEAAVRALESYVERHPRGYYLNDALYYLSDSYMRLDLRDGAIETLTRLADRGTTPYTAEALGRLAELTRAAGRHAESAAAFRRLCDAVSEPEARSRAMTSYVRETLAADDAALIAPMAADVASCADAGEVAVRESQFALAGTLRDGGDDRAALKIYRRLGDEVQSAEGAASAYYLLQALFDAGDLDGAEKEAFDYIDRETPHAYWLARVYLLLGDIYMKRGDAFQARATWQSVADGYTPADDGIVDEARKRIAALN